jgi:NAD(P)-dependent dehydrogenase (short-subunit alcohol dehydrogenase family)/acyl carrier protein
MWGLGRVVAREHPTFWGGLVDLDPDASTHDTAEQLWPEISGARGEDQLAFRQGRRYVGRLVRWHPSPAQAASFHWRTDGSYLITGGLGDLGLLVARWMVEQGARRLILLGRTRLPPRANWDAAEAGSHVSRQITAIRDLEALGASVHLAAVDVADEGELRGFLDAFRAEGWPPIRGVVHAAGILHDGMLVQLDAASLRAVLRPKMMGGWLLHRLLQDAALDFFVLFSSAGSVLGQPGQGNYAAANAFLDALAHHRHAEGRPALSINWGAWAGEGLAESAGGKRLAARLALLGISSIVPERALEALGRLLGQSATQVVAVPVDWKHYQEFSPVGSDTPLLSELAREGAAVARQGEHTSEQRDALLAAGPEERARLLQAYLSEQVGRSLGISPAKLEPQQPLSDLGLDSLMAVELKNRIAVDLKVNVPVVKFLQGFSIDQVVVQVLQELAAETDGTETPPIPTPGPPEESGNAARLLASLEQLSDEQVSSLLTEMLEEEQSGSLPH